MIVVRCCLFVVVLVAWRLLLIARCLCGGMSCCLLTVVAVCCLLFVVRCVSLFAAVPCVVCCCLVFVVVCCLL